MRLSFDPLNSSIPEELHGHLQASNSKDDRLRWMALAGAKLTNSDELVLSQLLRSKPRKAFSNQRRRYVVEDSSELGIALSAMSKRLNIDRSHAVELLCVVYWQSLVPEQSQPANSLSQPARGLASASSPSLAMSKADAKVLPAASEQMAAPIVQAEPCAQSEFFSFFHEN